MITIIFAVICLFFIGYLLNNKWELEKRVEVTKCIRDIWINKYNQCELDLDDAEEEIDSLMIYTKNADANIENLHNRLAFAGKNYIEKTNALKERLLYKQSVINELIKENRLLNTKINEKKKNTKADTKRQSRQTVQRTNKKKVQRLER